MPFMSGAALALGELRLLLGRRRFLVLGLPVLIGHAVNDLPGLGIIQRNALPLCRFTVPARKAVAAESGKVHQIDILHIRPRAQMRDKSAESGCLQPLGGGVVQCGVAHVSAPAHSHGVENANYNDPKKYLRGLFSAAAGAADPAQCLKPKLPQPGPGRNIVIGAGKAAAAMAAALEAAWGDADYEGVVVTRYGHAMPTKRIRVLEAAHPVPDANSEAAARDILHAVQGLGPQDQVVALISGGASALLALPVPGLTLEDKVFINKALLASGAPISTMNRIRKALSAIKGGKLAAACAPAKLVTLAISDVPGDDPAVIGSGPTWVEGADYRMIATPMMALQAAASIAGMPVEILGDDLEGEAAQLGRTHAELALSTKGPKLLLSGGETTVTIGNAKPGRGGRNTEYLLSLTVTLNGAANIWAMAGDTDGIDGSEDAAGALTGPDTLARSNAKALNADEYLAAHDSYSFFSALEDLIITGPTLTNVNDFRAILIK